MTEVANTYGLKTKKSKLNIKLKSVSSSKSYFFMKNKNCLVCKVSTPTKVTKTDIIQAFSLLQEQAKILKVRSLVYKPMSKLFRGKTSSTKSYKKFYIYLDRPLTQENN